MTVKIGNYAVEIHKNACKNAYVGTFIGDTTKAKVYGDSVAEVINEVEQIILKEENNK